MKASKILGLLSLAGLVAMAAHADEFTITPMLGTHYFSGKTEINPNDPTEQGVFRNLQYGLGAGYFYTPHLGVELNADWADAKKRAYKVGTNSIKYNDYAADVMYRFDKYFGTIQPFVLGGAGSARYAGNGDTTFNKGFGELGAGLIVHFNKYLSLRDGVNYVQMPNWHDWVTQVGLQVALGGYESAAPAAAPAPVVAPVPAPAPVPEPAPAPVAEPAPVVAPAPAPAPAILTHDEHMKVDVLFATGKANITHEDDATLQKVLDFMKQYPNAKVTIEGYTDNTGRPVLNRRLSLARADAVREALVKMGADAARLDAKGFGSANPVASNATAEGRAQNRRVIATAHSEAQTSTETTSKPEHKAMMKHHMKGHMKHHVRHVRHKVKAAAKAAQ